MKCFNFANEPKLVIKSEAYMLADSANIKLAEADNLVWQT